MQKQSYTTSGILHRILDPETRGKWTTRKFVLEIPGYQDRKEYRVFELFGDSCDKIERFREGDECEVKWDAKGRESNGRWFNTDSAWAIMRPSGGTADEERPARKSAPDREFSRPPEQQSERSRRYAETDDDIPF